MDYHYEITAVARNYNEQSIRQSIDYAERCLQEIIENHKQFIAACWEQLKKIEDTPFKQYVYFKRHRNIYVKNIYLHVGVRKYPAIEGGEKLSWTLADTAKLFGGKEHKDAREYAERLAAQYGCEIREEVF